MDCQHAQDAILESFVSPRPGTVPEVVEAHLAECAACAAFAASQHALDRGLRVSLVPPLASVELKHRVLERIRYKRRSYWFDFLPDIVHFGSCAAVTGLGIALLPVSATVVLTLGLVGTLLTHALLTAAHESFDAIEESL